MNKIKILVVDDEESLCEILQFNLEIEGYKVDVVYSAEEALSLPLEQYSLILLDVMMGQISGYDMLQMMKKTPAWANIPVIFCTAKDAEDNMVKGLTLGADDYISKPYSLREVAVRVKTVLRRTSGKNTLNTEELSFEELHIDLNKMKAFINDEEIYLTKKEIQILILLLRNKGILLSREEILAQVWSSDVIVLDRTIDVNITRLRKKIGVYGKYIETRQGYGYGFGI